MNAPDRFSAITREPFPQSRKIFVPGEQPGVQVPMREIALTNGEQVVVYDTSGPYTDTAADIDIAKGLPQLRREWIMARGDVAEYDARDGKNMLEITSVNGKVIEGKFSFFVS